MSFEEVIRRSTVTALDDIFYQKCVTQGHVWEGRLFYISILVWIYAHEGGKTGNWSGYCKRLHEKGKAWKVFE